MRKYIQRDLKKYVDYEAIRELEKSQYSQKADRSLQAIFVELIRQLDELEIESSEKDGRIKTLTEALAKQQREIIRRNEAEDREEGDHRHGKELTRNEKVRLMYARGFSQRQIAEEIGVSQQRVQAIIRKTDNPLFTFNVKPENFKKFAKKPGGVPIEERNLKICEWWDMGYTQQQIAKGTGLSQARISQIILEKCTQVQKTYTLQQKAKKNGVHRNTQAKIEKIRKIAPWLAEKCEAREVSVSFALRLIEGKGQRPSGSGAQKARTDKHKEAKR